MRSPSGAATRRASQSCPDAPAPRAPRLLPLALHEITTTPARHAQPRAWLRAVTWLVAAGLHPRAGARTLAVAEDLARRMDYTRGWVLYDLDSTAARLRVHRATVMRHVAVLRQLGALAWARHGTRANLHLAGRPYTATATIYAATIPPLYDEAMGHQVTGSGYGARVTGVSGAGRRRAIEEARTARTRRTGPAGRPARAPRAGRTRSAPSRPAGPSNVGTAPASSRHQRATHSLTPTTHPGTAEVSGGSTDTARTRRRRKPPAHSHHPRPGSGRHPHQVARDISIARQVRPLVPWTQRETLRRLAYALRPLIDRGLSPQQIAGDLHGMAGSWRPARPAAYITASLGRLQAHEAALRREQAAREAATQPVDHLEWGRAVRELWDRLAAATPARTDVDRRRARLYGWQDWEQVAERYEEDPDDALDLYGRRLVVWAVGRAARAGRR